MREESKRVEVRVACVFSSLLHSIIRNPQTRMLEKFLFSITILYKRGRAHSNTERRPKRSKKGNHYCAARRTTYIYITPH